MPTDRRVITELTLQNVLKIKAVRIVPPKTVVSISGKNAQGKSSVLSGIEMVLRGKSAFPDKPVREGETQAAGQIDLGDYIVTRHISPHSLEIRAKETNEKVQRPQEFLDSLLGRYTFDPLSLLRKTGKEQIDEVKRILGIDFSAQDKEYSDLYEKRREVARDVRILSSAMYSQGEVKPAKREEIDVLLSQLSKAQDINSANQRKQHQLEQAREALTLLKARKAEIERQLAEVDTTINEFISAGTKLRKEVDELVWVDMAEITNRIGEAEKRNEQARIYDDYVSRCGDLAAKKVDLQDIEDRMLAIEDEKKKVLHDAELAIAIDGLGIDMDGSLMYNSVPLTQVSQAEQIKVCMALAMRDNPNIGVILIREASLLDGDNLNLVADVAEKNGFQVWLERVDDKSGASFVIEDGEVVSEPTIV